MAAQQIPNKCVDAVGQELLPPRVAYGQAANQLYPGGGTWFGNGCRLRGRGRSIKNIATKDRPGADGYVRGKVYFVAGYY